MSIEVYIQHADFESDDNVIVEPNLVWPLIQEVDWSREREQMETLKADRKQFCPPNIGIHRNEANQEHWLTVECYSQNAFGVRITVHYPARFLGLIPRTAEKDIFRQLTALDEAKPLVEKFLTLSLDQLVTQVRDDSF